MPSKPNSLRDNGDDWFGPSRTRGSATHVAALVAIPFTIDHGESNEDRRGIVNPTVSSHSTYIYLHPYESVAEYATTTTRDGKI